METLRFVLKGKTAFFKVPEVNTYYYFTYGNIHKPALLGLMGAILGYKGYGQEYEKYPEYYEKLKDLKISIVPEKRDGHFIKKIQNFNNSVGYASREQGGNLIIREQWLEEPKWTIYVQLDSDESGKLANMILNKKCVYMPYLGKNDHIATIENECVISLDEVVDIEERQIHSLAPAKFFEFDWDSMDYKYEEFLPIALKQSTNHHILEKFILSNAEVISSQVPVYTDGVNNIVFY